MHPKQFIFCYLLVLLLPVFASAAQQEPVSARPNTDTTTLYRWVQDMKSSTKGPFARVRWFCRDGSILPPEPYACVPHGGGIQHGEWSEHTLTLRAEGFYIGNVLAAVDAQQLVEAAPKREELKQILLEQFLMAIDDGWIFRRARDYRGALQVEEELAGARQILIALMQRPLRNKQDYLLLRDAIRLLPHGQTSPLVTEIRQLSTDLAETDKGFEALRNKIHTLPDARDADRVRAYVKSKGLENNPPGFEQLAGDIDQLYRPAELPEKLAMLAGKIKDGVLSKRLRETAYIVMMHMDPDTRFQVSSEILALLRNQLQSVGDADQKLLALDTSLDIEREAFSSGTALLEHAAQASRAQNILWLEMANNALYGSGLLTARQWHSVRESLQRLDTPHLTLATYHEELRYLARVPSWAHRWLRYQYGDAIDKLEQIEPKISRYIPDQLRSGALLIFSVLLDKLIEDANRQAGIQNEMFGEEVGLGLRSLNPGLARGILYIPKPGEDPEQYHADGIYLLPVTTERLSRVAGILTLGEGNAVSHVQLLANNLGIPNVVIDQRLLDRLAAKAGTPVVLAVSPGGRVQLQQDGPQWDAVFGREDTSTTFVIRPDLDKLRLDKRDILPLGALRSTDTGRLAGPKACNLGELKYRFPQYVTDGLVIPFGVFRQLLDQPYDTQGTSVFEWLRAQYKTIREIRDAASRQRAVRKFLDRLRNWIEHADAGQVFRNRLQKALHETFGEDGGYSVFVRSDTNIEDLPGFTGAGLNLTVPNVSGFDNILRAISRVWASPFTERAYSWRQQHMDDPEHIYTSVLLLRSVPVDKSGVMITMNTETGAPDWLTIATNEGIGGAVAGQAAEELSVNMKTGGVRLLAEATSPTRRIMSQDGGLQTVPVSGSDMVMTLDNVSQLLSLALQLPERFPMQDEQGNAVAADVEFGFQHDKLALFQIRPYVRSKAARQNLYLNAMDKDLQRRLGKNIDMEAPLSKPNSGP